MNNETVNRDYSDVLNFVIQLREISARTLQYLQELSKALAEGYFERWLRPVKGIAEFLPDHFDNIDPLGEDTIAQLYEKIRHNLSSINTRLQTYLEKPIVDANLRQALENVLDKVNNILRPWERTAFHLKVYRIEELDAMLAAIANVDQEPTIPLNEHLEHIEIDRILAAIANVDQEPIIPLNEHITIAKSESIALKELEACLGHKILIAQTDEECLSNRVANQSTCLVTSTRITQLSLESLERLTFLPESFGTFRFLMNLGLNGSGLTSLPESFGCLQNLRYLSLFNNRLVSVPRSLGHLAKLKQLDLGANPLAELPESFGNLQQLKELSIRGAKLTQLPASFGALRNLQKLELEGNRLRALPNNFDQLADLRVIWLSSNRFTEFPDCLLSLSRLRVLKFANNTFRTLPEAIGNLPHLVTLHLESNELAALPSSLGTLTELEELSISYNKLEALPASLGQLRNLTHLYLDDNRLVALPESFTELRNLQHLSLWDNQLTTFPESLLQTLAEQGNPIYLSISHNPLATETVEMLKQYHDDYPNVQIEL
jgi:Leucine-rich repeat (LRR) protein